MTRFLFFAALLFGVGNVAAQSVLTGRITEVATGAPLAGASVVARGTGTPAGIAADAGGHFSLSLSPGTYEVTVSMVGFETAQRTVAIGQEARVTLDIALEETAVGLDELVVSATRMEIPLSAVSGAVTVLDREDIRQQTVTANSLGDVLGQLVPGLGISTGSPSNYGQSLRGRAISVMIDGVPQSTTRNTSRDLTNIDPAMIERVEVIRGATAIYGDGATGGIINIITRNPLAVGTRYTTDVQLGASVAAPGDGLSGHFTQTAQGRSGGLSYTASASMGQTGGFYDAEGDLIPSDPYGQGGLASTTSYDLHGKLGYVYGNQRFQLSANHFNSEQETSFVSDPSVNTLPPGEEKARAMEGLQLEENQGSANTVASFDYHHAALFGNRIHAQLFYRDYLTRFSPFDGRPYAAYRSIIQSYLESEKIGGRFEVERSLHAATGLQLLAGFDYTDERTQQPVAIIDSTAFDVSGGLVYNKVGERPWVPLMNPRQLGLFAQLAWNPVPWLDLQGGVRAERARLHVPNFTTLIGNRVTGGEVAYKPVLFNVGVVVHTTDASEMYASFSQGFSLTDLGLLLRNAADGFVVGSHTLKAQTVDNYEIGTRANGKAVRTSLSVFYNTSALGTTSAGLDKGVVRAPEQVYGVEATADVLPTNALRLGGTFTWTEGENDANEDGAYIALNTFRIQPLKLTGYIEHDTRPGWTNRLQVLYSGSRDRAFYERPNPNVVGFGERAVESYVVVDFITTLNVGPGQLNAGVSNLLNSQYYPVVSQLLWNGQNSSRAAAPGTRLTLGYTVTY